MSYCICDGDSFRMIALCCVLDRRFAMPAASFDARLSGDLTKITELIPSRFIEAEKSFFFTGRRIERISLAYNLQSEYTLNTPVIPSLCAF